MVIGIDMRRPLSLQRTSDGPNSGWNSSRVSENRAGRHENLGSRLRRKRGGTGVYSSIHLDKRLRSLP